MDHIWKGFTDGSFFWHPCSIRLHYSLMNDADDFLSLFASILKDNAEETIPKTLAVPKCLNKSWVT